MGNDTSVLSEYRIEETHYAETGSWALHTAWKKQEEFEKVTVFTGKFKNYGQPTKEFQRAIEKLKTIRHPAILKYINSCTTDETIYLFVEYVIPLNQILPQLSELEICCGLQNILYALDFIHSKANVVHNNVCKDTIFVTKEGNWKLGNFDLSCSFHEVTQGFLDQIRSFRYEKGIPPEDEGKSNFTNACVFARDIFAFGQLVIETASKCIESGVTNANVFCDLASKQMQNVNYQSRGTAASLTKHKFFDQPLLHAQDFLAEIAMKSQSEKEEFFRNLPSLLYATSESVIGSKMVNALLCRLVVLNSAAQQYLLPHLLMPRTDSTQGLFGEANYRLFVLPVISRIFAVRDAQIRLILLQYFPYYVRLIDTDTLVHSILPELLLGIKDTDDAIVAATLNTLACLVPILGGSTVIGGTRLKLFTNGMPKENEIRSVKVLEIGRRKSSTIDDRSNVSVNPTVNVRTLPERHEPDGGEDGGALSHQKTDGDEHWSDWEDEEQGVEKENNEGENLHSNVLVGYEESQLHRMPMGNEAYPAFVDSKPKRSTSPSRVTKRTLIDSDLSALEIQIKSRDDEVDYFADMEPKIISTPGVFTMDLDTVLVSSKLNGLDFKVQPQEEKDADDGWNWDD